MKRLVIGLMGLVFMIAFSGLSLAEEESYYSGKVLDYDWRSFRSITIKDVEGNVLTFRLIKGISWPARFRAPSEGDSVWLVVRGDTVRFFSMVKVPLHDLGEFSREVEKKIQEIKRRAANNLAFKGNTNPTEDHIIREASDIAMYECEREKSETNCIVFKYFSFKAFDEKKIKGGEKGGSQGEKKPSEGGVTKQGRNIGTLPVFLLLQW